MMKKFIIFTISSGIAGYIGYKIGYSSAKKKYENLADVEVESVKAKLKEYYETVKPSKKDKKEEGSVKVDISKSSIEETPKERVDIGTDYGAQYRTDSKADRIVGHPEEEPVFMNTEEEVIDTTKPHIITPEEFSESNNEIQTLFYFACKTLTDDDFNIISNIGIVGGFKILDQIGLYEPDCIHVRDNKKGIDYEVILEERTHDKVRPLGIIEEE